MTKKNQLSVNAEMCATCPFWDGSKYEFLRADLAESALNERSRICHSTGKNNAIFRSTGKPEALCRGARNVQLAFFRAIGFLSEATDAAWEAKRTEMGI